MGNKNINCCVVIPVYKADPGLTEILSFQQCLRVLYKYPVLVVAPENLNTEFYEQAAKGDLQIIRFNDTYFKDLAGYNRLMLSARFYERFIEYKYMLLYQLDAWIFRDELEYWCNKDYDYIGSPWVGHSWAGFAAAHYSFVRTLLYKIGYRNFNLVGNGGFSLRKVKSVLINLNFFKKKAENFNRNEDAFFSFYINSYNPFFKIPSLKTALDFGFDINPEQSFRLNNNRLPMGCHAWEKNYSFWDQFIPTA